jgi:ComF family protein
MTSIATIWSRVAGLVRSAGDLLLPEICLGCLAETAQSHSLCAQCLQKLLGLVGLPYCIRCGANGSSAADGKGCPNCPAILPRFDRLVRLGPYEPPLKGLIRQFKYRHQEGLAGYLGGLLSGAIVGQCPQETFDVVLAVPSHWRRRFSRSYDHARSLASSAARQLKLPLGHELARVRHTPPQAHLPRTRRIQNVRDAFAVTSAKAITGAKILLIDDVTTTGATAGEAARTLLDAGAFRVVLAVLAKAQPPLAYSHSKD